MINIKEYKIYSINSDGPVTYETSKPVMRINIVKFYNRENDSQIN
jgi:hypothetical protein